LKIIFKKNDQKMEAKIQLSDNATLPKRQTAGAAGYDLHSAESVGILPMNRKLVDTGIRIAIPPGYYGRIAPRSGLAGRGITCHPGTIDEDYRGTIKVLMINLQTDGDFTIAKGDRIAQLIFEKYYVFDLLNTKKMDETTRGEGGFGSTDAPRALA
jgi:dUTP pyrophosphatase